MSEDKSQGVLHTTENNRESFWNIWDWRETITVFFLSSELVHSFIETIGIFI